MSDKKEYPHAGHRDRLRARFKKDKLAGFHDYEVLELILTYAIPRKDVKALAKELIKYFGSFSAVFNASVMELQQVNGVGEKAALFLSLFSAVETFSAEERAKKPEVTLVNDNLKKYIHSKLRDVSRENFLTLYFSAGKELITDMMFSGEINSVSVHMRDIVNIACTHKAAYVIVAHNHPGNILDFSSGDIAATVCLDKALNLIGVELYDHIIIDSHQESISWRDCC